MSLDIKNKSYIGEYTGYGGSSQFLSVSATDRMRHLYMIGKTGSGKSTLLKNLIAQDIHRGDGICVIDPHGDLAEDVLNLIPSSRLEHVIYIDPADRENPIGFNPFDYQNDRDKSLVVSSLISALKNLWADSWGARMEYILLNTISALLEVPKSNGATILCIPKMLTDKRYRNWVIGHIKDPKVKSFWLDEFTQWNERELGAITSPILNKVGSFISSPMLRNILGQVKSSFSLQYVMDHKQILIVNLSKGKIGEDRANLLGSLLVSSLQVESMKRAYIPEEERIPYFAYLDEFQNFGTEAFVSILSESRKYAFSLCIAHQYTKQISETVKSAVIGNVGTLILFSMSAGDAEVFSTEFTKFPPEIMVKLGLGEAMVRQYKNGKNQEPEKVLCFPPVDFEHGLKDKIIKHSKMRFCKDREVIEGKIGRFYQQ